MTAAALIAPADFWQPFRDFSFTAFRLETLQSYAGSGEEQALAAFGSGLARPADPQEREWTRLIAANHKAGKAQQRVHIVAEPLSDYLRYELTWGYQPNVAAGEDVRIIPVAGDSWPGDLPHEDYWLFDSSEMYVNHYREDGLWLGAELITDPSRIVAAARWRDAALFHAIPWREFVSTHPELERHLTR